MMCVLCLLSFSIYRWIGIRIPTSFNYQSWLLAIQLNLVAIMLLDYGQLFTIKMMHLHILVFMKVIDLDLIFPMPLKLVNLNICNMCYGQISGRKLDLDKNHYLNFSTKFETLRSRTKLQLQHECYRTFSKLFIHIKNNSIQHLELQI